jgi:hypothetical protein
MLEIEKFIEISPAKLKNILVELWIDLVELYKDWVAWNYPTLTNAILN